MNFIILEAIQAFANLILSSDVFARILATVERWADKEIDDASKRAGVLAELEIIGLQLLQWEANLGVELAVAYLKKRETK
jgi:hypothetical protein